jgi:hypothetical protein
MIVVKDHASNLERRICLSSIRGPKVGNPRRDIKPEPYGHEAKDFLRQRLVGKQVSLLGPIFCEFVTMKFRREARHFSLLNTPNTSMAGKDQCLP